MSFNSLLLESTYSKVSDLEEFYIIIRNIPVLIADTWLKILRNCQVEVVIYHVISLLTLVTYCLTVRWIRAIFYAVSDANLIINLCWCTLPPKLISRGGCGLVCNIKSTKFLVRADVTWSSTFLFYCCAVILLILTYNQKIIELLLVISSINFLFASLCL